VPRRRAVVTCETNQPKHDVLEWKPGVLALVRHVLSLLDNMMFPAGNVMIWVGFCKVLLEVLLRQNMMCLSEKHVLLHMVSAHILGVPKHDIFCLKTCGPAICFRYSTALSHNRILVHFLHISQLEVHLTLQGKIHFSETSSVTTLA
jgi:hypothetical protein